MALFQHGVFAFLHAISGLRWRSVSSIYERTKLNKWRCVFFFYLKLCFKAVITHIFLPEIKSKCVYFILSATHRFHTCQPRHSCVFYWCIWWWYLVLTSLCSVVFPLLYPQSLLQTNHVADPGIYLFVFCSDIFSIWSSVVAITVHAKTTHSYFCSFTECMLFLHLQLLPVHHGMFRDIMVMVKFCIRGQNHRLVETSCSISAPSWFSLPDTDLCFHWGN